MLVDLPSWSGLAWKALEDLRREGVTNYSELEQPKNLNMPRSIPSELSAYVTRDTQSARRCNPAKAAIVRSQRIVQEDLQHIFSEQ